MSDDSHRRFQTRLDSMNKAWRGPEHTADAAAYVHDTVELAWLAATDIFGKDVSPDVAVALYDRIDEERLRRAEEDAKHRSEIPTSTR